MHHPWSQSHNQYNAPCSFSALRDPKCYVTPAFSGVPKRRGTKSDVKTYAKGHHDAPRNKAWIQRLSRFPQ